MLLHLPLLGSPICVSLVLEPQRLPGATERIVGKPEVMLGSSLLEKLPDSP